MKFSTQEEYGLRCLLQIARTGERGSLTIPEISQAEGLSDANVAKLLRILRLGGIIESTRGRVGGYSLACPPEEIRLAEVLAVLGGRLIDDDFCESFSGTRQICIHSVDCTIFSIWQTIQDAIDKVLHDTRLSDLLPSPEDESGNVTLTSITLPVNDEAVGKH